MKLNLFFGKMLPALIISSALVACSSNTKPTQAQSKGTYQPTQKIVGAPYNINYAANKIEFANAKTLGSLGEKWKNTNNTITIAHFGDSHIQPGWQVGPLRDTFQAIRGNAGRGMIFPYSTAKTYSQEDYSSSFTGKWKTSNSIHQPPKIALGVSGFVARTESPQAQVSFKFKRPISSSKVQATVLFKANGSYRLTMLSGGQTYTQTVSNSNKTQTIPFDLPRLGQDLTLTIQAENPGSEFELHGISLTNPNNTGVVYHNLGVGGSAYNSIIQQRLFDEQFPLLNADLVILDWGTNDLIYTNQIDEDLEWTIRQTIRKVRAKNPKAAILLTSVQEAAYKGRNVSISSTYAQLIKRIAKEEGTLFYDWYTVSGKSGSIALWRDLGFASKDGIHLNGKGYRIRAKLLGNALINALEDNR